MRKKEWFYKAAACIASAALTLTALPVISASAATSVKGTSHVTQFGEYNIEVTVGVEDQKIRSLLVEGKNFLTGESHLTGRAVFVTVDENGKKRPHGLS